MTLVAPTTYTEAVKEARKDAERAISRYEVLKALEKDEEDAFEDAIKPKVFKTLKKLRDNVPMRWKNYESKFSYFSKRVFTSGLSKDEISFSSLKWLLMKSRLSMTEIGRRSGLSRQTIYDVKKGKFLLKLKPLISLLKVLEVPDRDIAFWTIETMKERARRRAIRPKKRKNKNTGRKK